jgi:predicted metal-binding membrane protein
VHAVADVVPAVASRPWLVAAALLGAAGAVQLMPFVRRDLAIRHAFIASSPATAFRSGRTHATACIGCDGALMLVMFAAAGSLVWMAGLTILMCAERVIANGPRMASGAGVTMLIWAVLIVLGPPSIPSPFGPP